LDVPIKKRRLVSGKELVFRRPGEDSDTDEDGAGGADETALAEDEPGNELEDTNTPVVDESRITIHEDD